MVVCYEYINYTNARSENNSTYDSYFPIKLDASCNGFQHISLLIGDLNLAHHVNLLSPKSKF